MQRLQILYMCLWENPQNLIRLSSPLLKYLLNLWFQTLKSIQLKFKDFKTFKTWYERWRLQIVTTGGRAPCSPAWAASPSSVSYRRQEHLDLPGPHGGRSPWPSDPPGSEHETRPRKPGRSQTLVPEIFPHSPMSFPEIDEKQIRMNWH